MKCGISKLALRENQTKAISPSASYELVLTCSRGEYEKILQAHGGNTRKYWLAEVIENGCIQIWKNRLTPSVIFFFTGVLIFGFSSNFSMVFAFLVQFLSFLLIFAQF